MSDIGVVLELYKFAVSYSILMARQVTDAEDYLQECLIAILVCARQYHTLPEEELYKVCKQASRNRIMKLLRRKTWERKRFTDLEQAETVTISEEKQIQARMMIRKIFSHFQERETVFSGLIQGHSKNYVARKTGISLRGISRLLSQAKLLEV